MKNASLESPSSRHLLALEATVRLGSATLAAEQLSITQSAVSHRIRELEEALGQPLFQRIGRRLEPTPAAHLLADAVRHSAQQLQEAFKVIGRQPLSGSFTVSMLPALAAKWMAPKLGGLLDQFGTVDLRFTASRQFVDFQRDRVDVAIRYGRGRWQGVRSRLLSEECLAPVMSPRLCDGVSFGDPDAFANMILLRCDNPDTWERWFETAPYRQPAQRKLVFFDDDAAMIEAAVAGIGVALARAALVAQDIRAGRLLAPFGSVIPSRFSYWLVQDETRPERLADVEFLKWARAAFAEDVSIFDP